MKIFIAALVLMIAFGSALEAQSPSTLLAQATQIATRHAVAVAAREGVKIDASKVLLSANAETLVPSISEVAKGLRTTVVARADAVRCENMDCRAVGGSPVGVVMSDPKVDGERAQVDIEVWLVYQLLGKGQLYAQWDTLHLIQRGKVWEVESVESVGRT